MVCKKIPNYTLNHTATASAVATKTKFMNSIKKITFQSPINIDNGFTSTYQGDFTSTKELFADDEQTPSLIEWEVEDFATEHIGLQVEGKAVTGYDGVFDLPEQAIQMLEELGYDCTEVK